MDILTIAYVTLGFTVFTILMVIAGIFSGNYTFSRYIALAFDVFWNVITGGTVGITMSARAGVAETKGQRWGKAMSTFLSWMEKDHCQLAIQGDIDRAKSVIKELSPYDKRNIK